MSNQNKATLQSDINTKIYENSTQDITGANLNEVLTSINDSKVSKLDDIDTDSAFTANSDLLVPSQKAVKTANDLKENTSNKSTSTADYASTTMFPVWSVIVSYFDVTKIKSILGITTLSGSNTGDETNASITTLVNNATASGTPADTDKLPITNTGGTMKSLTWSLLKSTLNALFLSSADTFYAKMSNNLSDLTSASTARTNLGLGTLATQSGTFTDKKSIATGNAWKWCTTDASGNMTETAVTGSKIVITDSNGMPSTSGTTLTQLSYLDATSSIQTQLDTKTSKLITENAQTGTSYTLVLTDADKLLTNSNASANTVTIPPNSSVAFSVGTQIVGMQLGAGQTSIVAGLGVTILSSGGKLKVTGQYSGYTLIKQAINTWLLMGDISA